MVVCIFVILFTCFLFVRVCWLHSISSHASGVRGDRFVCLIFCFMYYLFVNVFGYPRFNCLIERLVDLCYSLYVAVKPCCEHKVWTGRLHSSSYMQPARCVYLYSSLFTLVCTMFGFCSIMFVFCFLYTFSLLDWC